MKPRTVRCLQEPNPLEEETWETPDIMDRLVPERTTTINKEGEYCFTASPGLWRVTADVLKEEQDVGLQWHYSSDRGEMAFVTNSPITNLHIMQANKTAAGHVTCLVPEDCIGLEVMMTEAGIARPEDKEQFYAYTDEHGNFSFQGVPKKKMIV